MFIPRGSSDACVSGVSCSTPSAAAPSDSNSGLDASLMEKPGSRRYIGIAMVAGLFFLIFLAWLYRAKWPRAVLRRFCSCSRRSKQLPQSMDEPRVDVITTTPSMSSEKEGSTLEDSGKGLVKEVSADMVVFTQVPKALGGKDRYPEWEMEHINGIRLEPRTPPRHNRS